MKAMAESWQLWAALSAVFAAMTAILAKVGVEDVNPNLATLIRTIVVLLFLVIVVAMTGQFHPETPLSRRALTFLLLSGLATGVSWLCYFRALKLGPVSRVAPIDKLSLMLVAILGVVVLGERLSSRSWIGVILMALGAILIAWKR